jgi:hypothetical protein
LRISTQGFEETVRRKIPGPVIGAMSSLSLVLSFFYKLRSDWMYVVNKTAKAKCEIQTLNVLEIGVRLSTSAEVHKSATPLED